MKSILVTGSGGLIGSEVVNFFDRLGWKVFGLDNNMRADFFGVNGDTTWNIKRLSIACSNYQHFEQDIRDRKGVKELIARLKPEAIVHCAAQPSHDLAASRPFDDFDVNAVGTLNLLEGLRNYSTEIPFVHMSTNKVYGDAPNNLNIVENETRWEYGDETFHEGISETFPIDQSKHSIFGASKVAADVMVQEYGRYFGMPTCCLRGGCLTGPNHSGVELHGFLSYLIKCNLTEKNYTIFGYKGKQVRDNIHAYDVARFIEEFLIQPRIGEVYNLGGGRENSISILEAFDLISSISGKKMRYEYSDQNRSGDHICYISDLSKVKAHYPRWSITKGLNLTFEEIYLSWKQRSA
ncbi:NAD-dependent epimerase [Roseivirga sp. 4D4]|uniref:NAD-dependent epimerase/dehydratase family protein n=1 Tax=Roseivirga sp. 4D4 TaxID=1889784 RepID=UPI000853EAE4|nr:NAD-dependent epimerase/dehydratase family protein [Roseivirga sp. 4D4]OEK02474.1 NAD-dependent epimerase [Roseivirga sp. 4D4]